MKRGYAQIYFIVLILLVSFSFFFNFNDIESVTGAVTKGELCTFDICDTDIYVGDDVVGSANVCKKEGVVGVRERASKIIREYWLNSYEGPELSNGEYAIRLQDGREGLVRFTFNYDERRKCSDEKIGLRELSSQDPCSSFTADDCPLDRCMVVTEEQNVATGGCFGIAPRTIRRCVERLCTPLPEDIIPRNPEKTLTFNLEGEGLTNTEIKVEVKKTDSGFKFERLNGNEYEAEVLAFGEFCKVIRGSIIKEGDSFDYPITLWDETHETDGTHCFYGVDRNQWGQFSPEKQYIYNFGVPQNNCPSRTVIEGQTTCLPWTNLCTVGANFNRYFNIRLGEYCGGWDAKPLETGFNAQQEVTACDQRVREAIENGGECNNNPPIIAVSGKSLPNFKEGDKCELSWAVNDVEDSTNQRETGLVVQRIVDELSSGDTFSKKPPYEQIMPYVMYDKEGKLNFQGTNLFRKVTGRAIDSGIDQDGNICQEKGETETSKDISIPIVEFGGKRAVQLPTLKFEITKTTYGKSCNPTSWDDAGFVIETTIERWLILEDCQLAGKTTLNFKYRNTLLGSPSNYSVRKGLYEAVEKALKGGISEVNLQKIKDFIFIYYDPPPQEEWRYVPLIVESVDGKVYISTVDHKSEGFALFPNKQKDLLLAVPSKGGFKSIVNEDGDEAIRSIEINVKEGSGGTAKRCFNNLKEDDQDGGFWGRRSIRRKNQAKKFAEIDAFYTEYVKGHYDKLREYFENARSCLCK